MPRDRNRERGQRCESDEVVKLFAFVFCEMGLKLIWK